MCKWDSISQSSFKLRKNNYLPRGICMCHSLIGCPTFYIHGRNPERCEQTIQIFADSIISITSIFFADSATSNKVLIHKQTIWQTTERAPTLRYLKTFSKPSIFLKPSFCLTSSDIVYSMAAYKVELLHNTPIYWNTSLTEVHQSRHSIQNFGCTQSLRILEPQEKWKEEKYMRWVSRQS